MPTITIDFSDEEMIAFKSAATEAGRIPEEFLKAIAVSTKKKKKAAKAMPESVAMPDDFEVFVLSLANQCDVDYSLMFEHLSRERSRKFVYEELLNAGERSAGIVGGAFVEDGLENLLKGCWRQIEKDAVKSIEYPGPLSTFSAKITLARLAGIIGPDTCRDLNLIREIRNRCAHWTSMDAQDVYRMTFNRSPLSEWCNKLKFGQTQTVNLPNGKVIEPTTPKDKFLVAAVLLGEQMSILAEQTRETVTQAALRGRFP